MDEGLGLFFDEEVQRLIDSFVYCFKVRITIFSTVIESMIVGFPVGVPHDLSDFCTLVREKFLSRCLQQDRQRCRRSSHGELVYQCFAGPTEMVMPILVDKALVGYAMIGQFRTRETLPQEIVNEWEKAGGKGERLQSAFLELPFFDKTSMDNMLRLFSMLINFIVTKDYVHFRHPNLVENVNHWLEDHLDEIIALNDVAAAIGKSPSSVSHSIKQHLGVSFKELCIHKRVQRFESIIISEPDSSIQEASSRVGYEDPLYFSRVYKKLRHLTPSEFRRSIRAK
jgi:AraC-like DNA-binding protein